MNPYPLLKLIVGALAASACALACSTAPGKGEGAAHQVTARAPAADAVARLRALPGVISVSDPAEDGALSVSTCAEEAIGEEVRASLPLQITVLTEDEAQAHSCGCIRDGGYHPVGARVKVACNTCDCHEGGQWSCTLLACLDAIETAVFFEAGSDALTTHTREALSEVAEMLGEQPDARVTIHAVGREGQTAALPARRADAVRRFLVAAGLDERRITVAPPRAPEGAAGGSSDRVDLEIAKD